MATIISSLAKPVPVIFRTTFALGTPSSSCFSCIWRRELHATRLTLSNHEKNHSGAVVVTKHITSRDRRVLEATESARLSPISPNSSISLPCVDLGARPRRARDVTLDDRKKTLQVLKKPSALPRFDGLERQNVEKKRKLGADPHAFAPSAAVPSESSGTSISKATAVQDPATRRNTFPRRLGGRGLRAVSRVVRTVHADKKASPLTRGTPILKTDRVPLARAAAKSPNHINSNSSKRRPPLAKMAAGSSAPRIVSPVLLICDVQDKFRNAIWEFPKVISTTKKMVEAAKILSMPILITTQNAARLGDTVDEITSILPSSPTAPPTFDKTKFSMLVPELHDKLTEISSSALTPSLSVILVGIETHICVTQTTLDLLGMGHKVYVLADGVSSCNVAERPVALNRLARDGATVTTSESLLFELLGDAKSASFKAMSGLVKDTKEETKGAVEALCRL